MKYHLFIGIDQSKLTFDAAILTGSLPAEHQHHQFENTTKGFKAFIKWIRSLHPKISLSEILICAENTGWYGYPLNMFLCNLKANLWVENALQIKLSAGLKRGKSDKMDASSIARYCYLHRDHARLYKIPGKTIVALRHLLAFREQLVKQQVSLTLVKKEFSIVESSVQDLIAKQSLLIRKMLKQKIELIDQQLSQLVEQDQELKEKYSLVNSVYGVGKQTALFILVYTNGFTSFNHWKKFACYCGIAPFEFTSGTSIRGKTRISSLGNKKLKSLLTMCALNTIKKDNELKQYYDRRIAEGKNAMSTINVLRNKLLSRIFAVVNRGTPYQKNRIDQYTIA